MNVLKVIPEHSEKLEQFFISFGHDRQATQEMQELQNALKDALEDLEHKLEEGKDIYERRLENVSLVHTLTEHSGFVSSVAISPDGQTLVSGSYDNTIKIWSLSTGKLLRTLTGHSDWVRCVAISPNGQTLVSGSDDRTIKIWRLNTGKLLRTLTEEYSGFVYSVAISLDGQTLVSGSCDDTIKIWCLSTGTLLGCLTEHSDGVNTVAISPDGQTLVSGSDDRTIKIWRLSTGKLLRTLTGHSDWVRCVAISPNGQTLVSGSDDRTIKIWRLNTGKLLRTLTEEYSGFVYSVAISPDGQTLASNRNYDDSITIWRCGISEIGIDTPESAYLMTELGILLYQRLRSATPFRYALVGVEVDEFRMYSELIEESSLPFPGLVLADTVWQLTGSSSAFRPFSPGYVWKPYEGEVYKPLMASPDLKSKLNELLAVG